jgi:hypothetical protein
MSIPPDELPIVKGQWVEVLRVDNRGHITGQKVEGEVRWFYNMAKTGAVSVGQGFGLTLFIVRLDPKNKGVLVEIQR